MLYRHELESMGEYSCSMPSGVVPGKVWRSLMRDGTWLVRMYSEPYMDKGREMCRAINHKVVMKSGPRPVNYCPPDWGNYARWCADR